MGLGFASVLAGPQGGQTGGQRPLPPPLQLVNFPAVVCSGSSALPDGMHGAEQTGYNTWILNYLTVHRLHSSLHPSLFQAVPGGRSPALFMLFSPLSSPRWTPMRNLLLQIIKSHLQKRRLGPSQAKVIIVVLARAWFCEESHGGRTRSAQKRWLLSASLSPIFRLSGKYPSKCSVAPVKPWHRLLRSPVRTYQVSAPCPTLSTEVLRGNATLLAFSGEQRAS